MKKTILENKTIFWITNFILILSAYFTTISNNLSNYVIVSLIFIIILSLPSYYGLIKFVGLNKALVIIFCLSLFAIIFETISLKTGFPYGKFEYTNLIGPKLFNIVPISIAFAWSPLVIGSFAVNITVFKNYKLILFLNALLLTLIDMTLDPGAVSLNFWQWVQKDFFYQVPLSNFVGWFISATLGSFLLYTLISKKTLIRLSNRSLKWMVTSLYLTLVYWSFIDIFHGLFIAGLIGIVIIILIFKLFFLNDFNNIMK